MECVILGNGPSLRTAVIPDLPTFGCNYIGEAGIQPTYYVCIDHNIIKIHSDRIFPTARDAQRSFLRYFGSYDPTPAPLYDLPNVERVTKKSYVFPKEHCASGGTATYMSLKIAYAMGFDTVYLYGVDYGTDHFSADYPQLKKVTYLPQWEYHYRIAADMYWQAGRRIINRSAPSILDTIFSFSTIPSAVPVRT